MAQVQAIHMLRRLDGSAKYRRVDARHLQDLSVVLAASGCRLLMEGADGDEEAGTVTYWWKRASELYVADERGNCDPLFDAAHGR